MRTRDEIDNAPAAACVCATGSTILHQLHLSLAVSLHSLYTILLRQIQSPNVIFFISTTLHKSSSQWPTTLPSERTSTSTVSLNFPFTLIHVPSNTVVDVGGVIGYIWDRSGITEHQVNDLAQFLRVERFSPAPPSIPQTFFRPAIKRTSTPPTTRWISFADNNEMLIYTDGCCFSNGINGAARAGCGFVFRPATRQRQLGAESFRLEDTGPTGEAHPQTNNRAELRAVIGALQFRAWMGENFTSIVIASDSEYVVAGITDWINKWRENGWRGSTNKPVMNRDLWECLITEIARLQLHGLRVRFWRIPREWNEEADKYAKEGAELPNCPSFTKLCGVLV